MTNTKFFFSVILFMAACCLLGFKTGDQQPKTITITITLNEADLIIKGLGKLSYEESAGLIQNIVGQAQKQLATDTTKPKKN